MLQVGLVTRQSLKLQPAVRLKDVTAGMSRQLVRLEDVTGFRKYQRYLYKFIILIYL